MSEQENKVKNKFSNRNFKQGVYHSLVIVVVLAIVILVNLFVGQLNLKVDLTKESVYTLTEETTRMANALTDKISLYYLVKEGEEYQVLQNVVEQYGKLSNITTTWKDPELYPQFALEYTDSELQGNDIIIVNETTGTSRFIPFSDMYITDYSVNYTTYNYDYKYTLDAEGQITSAIQYVTAGSRTNMYVVSAHNEVALEDNMKSMVAKANIEMLDFDVLTQTSVPEDCDILFINGPTVDISAEELVMYKEYLDNGGNMILSVSYTDKDMSNYNELLAYYGVDIDYGVIVEQEGSYLNYQTYLINYFASVTEEISSEFEMSDFIITPIAMSLKVQEEGEMRSTLSVKPVVVSTDKSYAKVDPQSSEIGKEEGDISGPFDLVIQATDTYKDNSSKVVMLASPYLLMDDWIDYYSCVNAELFIDCLDWMNDSTVASITIPQRSLDAVYLEVGMNEATLWAVITVIIIPLCILAIGFVVWYFRRKH